jgi:glutamine synthetase
MPATISTHSHHAFGLQNPLCRMIDKEREDFTREDLLKVIGDAEIERITFHYTALDGKFKELKLPITGRLHAERILAEGERVDGSSLFPGLVEPTYSDLYVVPLYRSAFFNPFDSASLDFTCRFLGRDGTLAPFAPDTVLHKAARMFTKKTGLELQALGELEFFLMTDMTRPERFACEPHVHYHASAPFAKHGDLLDELVRLMAQVTGAVKYGHAELGSIDRVQSDIEEIRGKQGEQLEIEFLPMPIEDCGDALVLARWLIRSVAWRHGAVATFAPKIGEDTAGNGLHIHMQLMRDGRNVMTDDGKLSKPARALVGGLCDYGASLTAFGNTVASSYLRLGNHESPSRVCWSDLNRGAMIRVPLGWSTVDDLGSIVNPQQGSRFRDPQSRQTIELRTPDGSAFVHLLLAGMTLAAEHGINSEGAQKTAAKLYIAENERPTTQGLPNLPHSCVESARLLRDKRAWFEREGVFPPTVLNYICELLESEDDEHLASALAGMKQEDRVAQTRRVMHRNLHRH